ncbi:F-box family protein, partial [Trifolium medium]|nr:F-box family protein [Trifolium medium]
FDVFTVKSTFFIIFELSVPTVLVPPWHAPAFKAIWKCPAPSKVNEFVWQLLHDRIPTRLNLVRRRIIAADGDCSCALCGKTSESTVMLH